MKIMEIPLNQRILKPVHDWNMEVLDTIPMDGTRHQEHPLDRQHGERVCFSFDLKSDTDRWPLDWSSCSRSLHTCSTDRLPLL